MEQVDRDQIINELEKEAYSIFDLAESFNSKFNEFLKRYTTSILKDFGLETLSLEQLHLSLKQEQLNTFRLKLIKSISETNELTDLIYAELTHLLHSLVGPDIAVQKIPGLSIQFPGDESSILPFHSDVHAGNSPYEFVFWLPITRAEGTNAMFLLPLQESLKLERRGWDESKALSDIKSEYKDDLIRTGSGPGQAMIFSHNLFHGNTVNEEGFTRVSLNIRFKSLLTPFGEKKLGSYFRVLNVSPITRIGVMFES